MKAQRLAVVLSVVNLILLLLAMTQMRSATAQTVAPLLRTNMLEIVDERNVVRARLGVKGVNGPIELDLFDRNGIVGVKLGAGEDGAGLLVAARGTNHATRAQGQTYVQIIARMIGTPESPATRIMLKGADGRERVITP